MRKILIVGAGQAGLQLAFGLQARDYDVTVVSNRTADEMRGGRVTSTQCMFGSALAQERADGLDFWADQAPRITGLGISVAAQETARAVPDTAAAPGAARAVAGTLPPIADRIANGFDTPADFEPWFYDPTSAADYLAACAG